MGSSIPPPADAADLAFVASLREAASREPDGFVSFERFMALALYHPELGFYTRREARVGRDPHTHFYTATSLGPVFGELVLAATLEHLQQRGADPATHRFIEIGTEQGRSVLDGLAHPFAAVVPVGIGMDLQIQGPAVVFSNELFDAQPCARFLKAGDVWLERGVRVEEQHRLVECLRPAAAATAAILPADAPPGYALDLPRAADALAARIADEPWTGLFLAFDYGKTWTELTRETPQGTARAYHLHRQTTDLLARPGRQDLTCHICWDTVAATLAVRGFQVAPVLSQEAFLIKNASATLAKIVQDEAPGLSARKAGLMQLLHPSALGQKFQVLTAWR